MDTKLKDQLLEIAKSNNLLAANHNSEDSNALIKEAFAEAQRAYQAIKQEPLFLVNAFAKLYPELKSDLCPYNCALIEDAAFSYELNTVMSLHSALPNSKSDVSEQEQVRANASHTFELQRVLPLPQKISRLTAKVMSLGMYAQISKRAQDFHDYLTIVLPLLAKINAHVLQAKVNSLESVHKATSLATCSETSLEPGSKSDSHVSCTLYECEQNILLLKLLPIWALIFSKDYQGLLTKLDEFHKLLVSFAKDLELANNMQEKANFALYMSIILLMEEATKVLVEQHLGATLSNQDAALAIESKIQTAIAKCDQLHMADLEIIARSLKMILLLDMPIQE